MATAKTVPLRTKRDGSNGKAAPAGRVTKKTAAAKPIVRIGILVHDVARMRKTIFDQAVKEMGITRAQWWALANLSRHKSEGMTQSDLARVLDVGKPTIGGVKNIFITVHGYDLIYYMSPIAASLNTAFLAGINEKDIKVAEAVLEQLKENLQQLFESGPNLKLPKAFKAKLEAMRDADE